MSSNPKQTTTIFVVALILSSVSPFSFSYTAPTECGPLTVSWTGGFSPYSILVTPVWGNPTVISIPGSAMTGGNGIYTTQLDLRTDERFLLTMSDATGFGTGGTSGTLSVAEPVDGASCNTTVPDPPFTFELPDTLQQCLPYHIDNFNGSISPVTIYGIIPLGTSFELPVPAGQTNYTWPAVNVTAGTPIVFTLFDASGNTGGSSGLNTVENSNSNTCLGSTTSTSSVSGSPTSRPLSGSSNTGAIIGGSIAGVVLFTGIVGGLVFYFCLYKGQGWKPARFSVQWQKRQAIDIEPDEGPSMAHGLDGAANYEPEPYMLPASTERPNSFVSFSDSRTYPLGQNTYTAEQGRIGGPATNSRNGTSKYSEAFSSNRQSNTSTRVVLHVDGGEAPNEADEEIVELPPQYSTITGGANVAGGSTQHERDLNPAASTFTSPGESTDPASTGSAID